MSISGPSPSIDQALHQPVHGLDIRDMMRLFYLPMQACESISVMCSTMLIKVEISHTWCDKLGEGRR